MDKKLPNHLKRTILENFDQGLTPELETVEMNGKVEY